MNKKPTRAKPGDEVPDEYGMTPAAYARLRAKTDADIARDCEGDPDTRLSTPERLAKARRIARAKFIREQLVMSQAGFAKAYGIPLATLRDWEMHRAKPDGVAESYLEAIFAAPEEVRAAFRKGSKSKRRQPTALTTRRATPAP